MDKLFRFNVNPLLFLSNSIMDPKRVISRLFHWDCCVVDHIGQARNDIFWVYITWNNLSETEDWASISKDWIGLTVLVWKLQIRVDMAKSYTKIRRVKYDEPMRERERCLDLPGFDSKKVQQIFELNFLPPFIGHLLYILWFKTSD